MDSNGAGGDAPGGWSLDDIERYFTLQRLLPKNGGLFGSGWAQFMANQENAGAGAARPSFMPYTPPKPLVLPPWTTPPIMPQETSKVPPFSQVQAAALAATSEQNSPVPGVWQAFAPPGQGSLSPDHVWAADPSDPQASDPTATDGAADPTPYTGAYRATARDPSSIWGDNGLGLDRQLYSPADPAKLLLASARSQPRPDASEAPEANRSPSQQGPAGSRTISPNLPGSLSPLRPSNGFFSYLFGGPVPLHTPSGQVIGYYDHQAARAGLQLTGDYANIAQGVYQPELEMPALLEHLAPGVSEAVARAIEEAVERHHPYPKFMGGPAAQELVELIVSKHRAFHADLASALRDAGFLRVGGWKGGTRDWLKYFQANPGSEEKAIEILRQVTAEFDRVHGTSITPKLEKALLSAGKLKPSP